MGKPKLQILTPPKEFDTNSVIIEPVKTSQPQISSFNSSEFDRINLIASHGGNFIYKVINRNTSQIYALKVMPVQDDTIVRQQIFRGAQTMMNMHHENIVKYHGLVEEQGVIQVLYEFVNGMPLVGAHITDEFRLSNICQQVLSAIAFLHSNRIALRNIKPSNILISEHDDHVKILNFGFISRIFSPDTIAYMSPERISSEEFNIWGPYDGFRDDIWGFGLSVLEVYLGMYPLVVEREGDWKCLVDAICDRSLMLEAPESSSSGFRDFIRCCLQRNPAMRSSAHELLEHPFVLQ